MLRTATPPMVRNVGRDRWLRLLNSTSGAISSRRFKACAFCLAEKLRRSGAVTSGREANRLDWFRSERSAKAVQAGPDLSLIHISEPTRLGMISYAVFCLKKKKKKNKK